jgi:hypothetical protein
MDEIVGQVPGIPGGEPVQVVAQIGEQDNRFVSRNGVRFPEVPAPVEQAQPMGNRFKMFMVSQAKVT